MPDKTDSFLSRYKLTVNTAGYEDECRRFIGEMDRGLSSENAGLPMIHTYVSDDRPVPVNQKIIAVDAGGTNLRVATVYFDAERRPVIENFKRYPMPGIEREITADELFGSLAEYILPLCGMSERIGFCFSYASKATEDRDAIVIELSKEVKVKDIRGLAIGAELQKRLFEKGAGQKRFTLVNDTVATQLAGKTAAGGADSGGYLGYILGTGLNICYTEKNGNITKLPEGYPKDGRMIINVESGYYNLYERGEIDFALDRESKEPGSHILEKMTSGAYLGNIIRRVLDKAAGEGLFSGACAKQLASIDEIPLSYIDAFYEDRQSANPLASCFGSDENDLIAAVKLIDGIMRRAAYVNAVTIGAALIKANAGKDKEHPAVLCADGTTFYKTAWLRDHMFPMFEELIEKKLRRYFRAVKVEDAPLVGTAIAGLIN